MRGVLTMISRVVIAAPKRVLLVVMLLTVLAAVFGANVAEHLGAGGFQDPSSQSARGVKVLTEKFGLGNMDLTLVVRSPSGVLEPAAAEAGRRLVDEVRNAPYISGVVSPWDDEFARREGLISEDGKTALVIARVSGGENNAPKYAKDVADRVSGEHDGLTVLAGGTAMVASEINEQSEKDLLSAELIALPLSLIVLVWVFGGLFAALLPLVVGVMAIIGTLGMIRGITLFADVSIFALDLTTAMGLALAIDYTLLLVSRYREEHAQSGNRDEALRRAVATAGRTILFSACTVFLAVGALAVFPMYFLRSMAYAGCGVVALAGLYAVVVAPAVIKLLGDRIESLNIRNLFRHKAKEQSITNSWLYSTVTFVMRHAFPCALAVVALLLVLGAPFLSARFGLPDDRVLPTSAQSRQVGDTLRTEFPGNEATATSIVIPDARGLTGDELTGYAAALSNVPGVVAVSAPDGSYVAGRAVGPPASATGVEDGSVWLSVAIENPSSDSQSREELDRLRAVAVPGGAEALFTGPNQLNQDSVDEIVRLLPIVLTLVATTTFLLIFLLTGSLLLPVKALVLNTLSLSATLGALVWVFQEGHLGGLGTTATGTLVADVLVFLFATAFGLSMDYEVFLLSRIREHWLASPQRSEDNAKSVALGIAGAGRVITAAALLMVIVFAALSSGQVAFLRMIGVGLALAVVVDATLVRMVLVPAVMKLAGRWNWWAPGPLATLHAKIGLDG